MITGNVFNRHALVSVTFRRPNQPDLALEFVVDTGFAGFLTLPLAAVQILGLPYQFDTPANLADDSEIELQVFGATILWNGMERDVRVLTTGKRPLLGTSLLEGCELVAQFHENGLVTIDEL
jgi:clan AA aspartic protease